MKIAGVQMNVQLGEVDANLERIASFLHLTAEQSAGLVVFPECALTGYCFDSLEEGRSHAQTIPGPATEKIAEVCAETRQHAVFGLLEADGDRLFNAAAIVGLNGLVGAYRKVHIPFLGIDRFTTPGDRPFAVHDVEGVRVGMNICYDSAFPEAARCLMLEGADIIVLPTNFPPGAECMTASVVPARAMENGIYYAAINRVGTERGFTFLGTSKICGPNGAVLASSTGTEEEILYAEIDVSQARNKRIVRVPDKHEIDRLGDRRPEMYQPLVTPHDFHTPHDDHQS